MKCLILYSSLSGNTEKVAMRIRDTIENDIEIIKIDRETNIDLYHYDLVFLGSPVIQWLPTKILMDFVSRTLVRYHKSGDLIPCSPVRPGKYAICFCTYAGPHTGISEAVPAIKWMRTFFEHIGFTVLDEWYTVGEYKRSEENSTMGRLGDIKGRPSEDDLLEIENKTRGILKTLKLRKTETKQR
ncbi:MAG: flavodoxin [Methanomicrobia archaeon]|nr:flavodoxin [Methanomicrobia archaeon]